MTNRILRKKKKTHIENYYKILGTTAKAGQKKIREKYIEKIREFPPETHPEEFQKIRRAYEILRDPSKRKEYDIMRKYGDKIDKILNEAFECIEDGELKQAEKLLIKAKKIYPDKPQIYVGFADIALQEDNLDEYNKQYDIAIELADKDIKQYIITSKIRKLIWASYEKEALNEFEKYVDEIKDVEMMRDLKKVVYFHNERYNDLKEIIEETIPKYGEEKFEDIYIMLDWLNVVFMTEKWNEVGKVKNRIKRILKSIQDEEEKKLAIGIMAYDFSDCIQLGKFREAEIYIDFLYWLAPKDEIVKKHKKEIGRISKLEKEIDRINRDEKIFPLIAIRATELFAERYMSEEIYDEFIEDIPWDFVRELEEMSEEIAIAIMCLKKKYKLIFNEFKEEWNEMLKKHTAGFNREMRRMLKKYNN